MATFLDRTSYEMYGQAILLDSLREIIEYFKKPLKDNECQLNKLEDEFDMLFSHVIKFLSNISSPSKVWQVLFKKQFTLGLTNILHIAEICIVSPLGNAEAERVFSLLWRLFTKDRSSLSNKSQEDLLHIRSTTVCKDQAYYQKAMNLFIVIWI